VLCGTLAGFTGRFSFLDEVMDKKQNQHLRSSIRFLGGLLGKTIIAQEGQSVFDMVEEIRGLAKTGRSGGNCLLIRRSLSRIYRWR